MFGNDAKNKPEQKGLLAQWKHLQSITRGISGMILGKVHKTPLKSPS